MNYVYKIVGDFESLDFEKVLDKLSQKFQFMYVDDTLFLVAKKWDNYSEAIELMKNTIKPAKNFYIKELNKNDVEKQQSFIKDWCVTNSVRLDRERYEKNCQERLKNAWASMDELEEKLKQIAMENERKEESDGKSNNEG